MDAISPPPGRGIGKRPERTPGGAFPGQVRVVDPSVPAALHSAGEIERFPPARFPDPGRQSVSDGGGRSRLGDREQYRRGDAAVCAPPVGRSASSRARRRFGAGGVGGGDEDLAEDDECLVLMIVQKQGLPIGARQFLRGVVIGRKLAGGGYTTRYGR